MPRFQHRSNPIQDSIVPDESRLELRRCIVCLLEKGVHAFNEEHVFPYALGGRFVISTVCQSCNEALGREVDAPLSGSFPLLCAAANSGVTTRSGAVDPFRKIKFHTADGTPIDLNANPDMSLSARVQTHETTTDAERATGEATLHFDSTQRKSAEAAVETKRQRLIAQGVDPSKIQIELEEVTLDAPPLQAQIQVDGAAIVRGMVKIAYELASHWLGPEFVEESEAAMMRAFMLADKNIGDLAALVSLDVHSSLMKSTAPVTGLAAPGSQEHMGVAYRSQDELRMFVCLFGIMWIDIRATGRADLLAEGDAIGIQINPSTGAETYSSVSRPPQPPASGS